MVGVHVDLLLDLDWTVSDTKATSECPIRLRDSVWLRGMDLEVELVGRLVSGRRRQLRNDAHIIELFALTWRLLGGGLALIPSIDGL